MGRVSHSTFFGGLPMADSGPLEKSVVSLAMILRLRLNRVYYDIVAVPLCGIDKAKSGFIFE